MTDAMDETTELFKQLTEKAKKYSRCLTCKGSPIHEKTHFTPRDKSKPKHVKEKLSEAETKEWIRAEIKKQLGESVVAPQPAHANAQPAISSQQSPAVGQEVYRLPFGCHKGSTIELVMKKAPGYFASLVQQTPRDKEPLQDRSGYLPKVEKGRVLFSGHKSLFQ